MVGWLYMERARKEQLPDENSASYRPSEQEVDVRLMGMTAVTEGASGFKY